MIRPTVTRRHAWLLPLCAAAVLAASAGFRLQAQNTARHNPLRAAYMQAHFSQTMAMHDAIARGDLHGAKLEATILAQRSPTVPMPVGSEAFHGALTQAAREAAAATTLRAAADSASTVLGICGQCHQAMQVRASVPAGKDIKVGGLVGHMLLHQHGADALIEGLVGPSDSQWGEGVRTFASPKLEADHVPGKIKGTMRDSETALAVLAGHAAQAHRTRDRVAIYGRILATCGECHRSYGKHAGPEHKEQ
jgi:hypothetical protein